MPVLPLTIPRNTVKESIVLALVQIMESADYDTADPSMGTLFFKVMRGTVDDIPRRFVPALAIEEGDEEVIDLFNGKVEKVQRLYMNFKIPNEKGVDAETFFNYYAGRVVQECKKDLTVGGLAIDVKEVGSAPEISGDSDSMPGGSVVIDIRYRHLASDPFTKG